MRPAAMPISGGFSPSSANTSTLSTQAGLTIGLASDARCATSGAGLAASGRADVAASSDAAGGRLHHAHSLHLRPRLRRHWRGAGGGPMDACLWHSIALSIGTRVGLARSRSGNCCLTRSLEAGNVEAVESMLCLSHVLHGSLNSTASLRMALHERQEIDKVAESAAEFPGQEGNCHSYSGSQISKTASAASRQTSSRGGRKNCEGLAGLSFIVVASFMLPAWPVTKNDRIVA